MSPEAALMFLFICHVAECKFLYIIGPERVEVLNRTSSQLSPPPPPPPPPPPRCWCINRLWDFFWFQLKLYRGGQLTGMTGRLCDAAEADKKERRMKMSFVWLLLFLKSTFRDRKPRAAWKNGGKRWFHPFQQTSDRVKSTHVLLKGAELLKRTRSDILPPPDHHSLLLSEAKTEFQTRISIDPNFSFLMVLCSELRSASSDLNSLPETVSPPRICSCEKTQVYVPVGSQRFILTSDLKTSFTHTAAIFPEVTCRVGSRQIRQIFHIHGERKVCADPLAAVAQQLTERKMADTLNKN